jgi:hypothetical protein
MFFTLMLANSRYEAKGVNGISMIFEPEKTNELCQILQDQGFHAIANGDQLMVIFKRAS